MGKPSREVLTPLLRLSGPTQSGLIGPLLYNPFRLSCFEFRVGPFLGGISGATPVRWSGAQFPAVLRFRPICASAAHASHFVPRDFQAF